MAKKMDYILGIIFAAATVVFVIAFLTDDMFFNWAFERHHNVLSWYIRPIFIIPIAFLLIRKA